jgi:membrane-associated protease RseP (regulator of RpoE activity)
MWKKSWWSVVGAGVLSASLPLASFGQAEGPAPEDRPVLKALRLVAQQAADGKEVIALTEDRQPSQFWIGLGLGGELSDIVKEQLGLEHGLVVEDVFEDSAALKAGFKKNDILVKVGDQALKEPADLLKAVEKAKETELTITLLRGGKELSLKVTPAKRPTQEFEARIIELPKDGQPDKLQEEIKRLEEALKALREKGGNEGAGILFARPGVVASRTANVIIKHEFPKDLSISVTKEGDAPAKIRVKRGDKEWDVTEDKLGELPDDVRPHVHHFFGGLWGPGLKEMAVRSFVGGPKPGQYAVPGTQPAVAVPHVHVVPATPATPVPAPPDAEGTRINRTFQYRIETHADAKFDEILKEIKQLRKDVDDLRGKSNDEMK